MASPVAPNSGRSLCGRRTSTPVHVDHRRVNLVPGLCRQAHHRHPSQRRRRGQASTSRLWRAGLRDYASARSQHRLLARAHPRRPRPHLPGGERVGAPGIVPVRDWLRRSSSDRQHYEREKIRLRRSDWPMRRITMPTRRARSWGHDPAGPRRGPRRADLVSASGHAPRVPALARSRQRTRMRVARTIAAGPRPSSSLHASSSAARRWTPR